ncbi:MAG: hypothetical protein QG620_579 [Patescibacteria group bacterium]|nr:hypothetical protein [Patescibacteria group bacterium]
MQTYEYLIVEGPDPIELNESLFKGKEISISVQKCFGDTSYEHWSVLIDSVKVRDDDDRFEEVFFIAGRVLASGLEPGFLNRNISCCTFAGFWNKKERMSHIEVAVV